MVLLLFLFISGGQIKMLGGSRILTHVYGMGRGDTEHQTVCLVLVLWQLLWQMLSVCELTVQVPCGNYGVLTFRSHASHQPPILSTKKPEWARKVQGHW